MKTVCVVGLGPAGITAVKELKGAGLDVTGYDSGSRIGGRWSLEWSNFQHGAWKQLIMNNPRHINEFSDFPWLADDYKNKPGVQSDWLGAFAHSTECGHYLQAYADRFELNDSFMLNTTVTKIDRDPYGKGWIVHTQNSETKHFDGLVLCLGRYRKALNPLVNGDGTGPLDGFTGTVIHSADFKSTEIAKDKRVLVVGSSVSGCDITSSLAVEGKCTSLSNSMRHIPYMVNRLSDKGYIADELLFTRLVVHLNLLLPESVNMKGLQATVLENYPNQVTEEMTGDAKLVPDPDIAKSGVSYAHDWVENLREQKFTLRPGVQSSNGKTVTFSDGSSADFDLIICGTGYSMDFSMLPDDVSSQFAFTNPWSKQTEAALYKWTLVPDMDDIAVCGAANAVGVPFPLFEMNSRWIAQLFSGKLARPSEETIHKAAQDFRAFRESSPGHRGDLSVLVTELIAQELGLAPSFWQLLSPSSACSREPSK